MTTDNEMQAFYQILQKFRRIDWGSKLESMTQGEFMALSAIHAFQTAQPDKPGVYVSVLAEELTLSVSMVSKMLRVLEEKGFILRTVDPDSRRNTFVSLTDYGRERYARESVRAQAVNQRVMASMGPERVARFLQDAEELAECYGRELGTL